MMSNNRNLVNHTLESVDVKSSQGCVDPTTKSVFEEMQELLKRKEEFLVERAKWRRRRKK